jgi:predicted phage-related endonuclease
MTFYPVPADRDEWLAMRQKHIGASEIAALFGVQANYALSHFDLWHVKKGNAPPPFVGGPRVNWGKRLEDVIAEAAAEEFHYTSYKGRFAICDDCHGMSATLDYEVESDPKGEFTGPGVMECKAVDWLQHKKTWVDGEPPFQILLQEQAQMACAGYSWGTTPHLIGGNNLQDYRFVARPGLIAEMKARVNAFWQSIRDNIPPPPDGSSCTADILRSLYPEVVDDVIDLSFSNEWPEACADFYAAGESRRDANKVYEGAKNRVVSLLGSHKRGYGAGWSVNTSVTPENPGRPATAGEIIGKRAEIRKYTVKENITS